MTDRDSLNSVQHDDPSLTPRCEDISPDDDLAAILEGIEDMIAGRTHPLADVEDDIRRRHGWPSARKPAS